ncbi:MAG: hypothetical protein ABIS14_04475, partial [Sphingomonas sp.]
KVARWVRIAEGREAFLAELDAALREETPEAMAARLGAVADQSWDNRVVEVLKEVGSALAAQQS